MSEGYQKVDIDRSTRRANPRAMLLADLADFVARHGVGFHADRARP